MTAIIVSFCCFLAVLAAASGLVTASDVEWVLAFSEEFDGDGPPIDSTKFQAMTGYSYGTGEVAYFTNRSDNLFKSNGTLKLRALHETFSYPGGTAQYTSAGITSVPSFLYGKFQASLKLPAGRGTWPAFWMLAADCGSVGWPMCGEIDIVENVGFSPNIAHCTLHDESNNWMRDNQITNTTNVPTMYTDFVLYEAEWTPAGITMRVGGVDVVTYPNPQQCSNDNWPYHVPFTVMIDYQVGGSWGGTKGIDNKMFPNAIEVDYIRIYESATPWFVPACNTTAFYLELQPPAALDLLNMTTRALFFNDPARFPMIADALRMELGAALATASANTVADVRLLPNPATGALVINFTLVNQSWFNGTLVSRMQTQAQLPLPFWLPKTAQALDALTEAVLAAWLVGGGNWSALNFSGLPPSALADAHGLAFRPSRQLPGSVYIPEYDFGGPGVGYLDSTTWNLCGEYQRAGLDGVDVGPAYSGACDSPLSRDCTVAYSVTGEFLRYSGLTVNRSGDFVLRFNYSNGFSDAGLLDVELDGVLLPQSWQLPSTGGWNLFEMSRTFDAIPLAAGVHTLRLLFPLPNYNLHSVHIWRTEDDAWMSVTR